jgi:four helix bundle protein
MVVRRYQDFIAWQLGEQLKLDIFRIVLGSRKAKADLRFMSQILEAARSVPGNIAEGFLRCSPGDFARFLDYSIASIGEAERRLHDGAQLNYFAIEECADAFKLARRCLTACVRLKQSQIRYLRDNPKRPRRRGKRPAQANHGQPE